MTEPKKKIPDYVSQHYRDMQKKSREKLNENLLKRAEALKKSGLMKTGNE